MGIECFPIEIVSKMIERQVEQGNNSDYVVFKRNICSDKRNGGFNWEDTVEGDYFWHEVINKECFDVFFEKYPHYKVTIISEYNNFKKVESNLRLMLKNKFSNILKETSKENPTLISGFISDGHPVDIKIWIEEYNNIVFEFNGLKSYAFSEIQIDELVKILEELER
jgi:hypothetical protein